MAKSKDDPLLNRLFEGPAGGDKAAEGADDARARAALRRQVLGIIDGAGDDSALAPLDDGLIAAYLDDALEANERAALEARFAASPMLREQVTAASLARDAALEGGLSMPAALAADYDAVPGPAAAAPAPKTERPVGLFGRLFGGPIRARRWLAASVPALIVAVVAVALGPQIFSERAALQKTGEGAGTATPKVAADAKARRAPVKDREADLRKRDVSPQPAEAAKLKPEPARRQARRFAEEKKKEASKEAKPGGATLGKNLSVLTTTVVPLSSELREAVVTLGRSQQGAGFAPPAKSEAERRSAGPMRPSTGSSADQAARESRSDKSVSGLLSQGRRGLGGSYIDVINRAVAPDCTKDPAACCGSHQVDQDLLNRLQTSQPPQSVKVLHLSSRACYLTLP